MKITVKVILSALFLVCLFKMPYGYFQLVRFIGLGSFMGLAYLEIKRNETALAILWLCSAILINPIIKVPLGRLIWNIADIAWVIIILITIIKDFSISKRAKVK